MKTAIGLVASTFLLGGCMTQPIDPAYNFASDNEKTLCHIVLLQDIQRAKDELSRRGITINSREDAAKCMHAHRFQIP